MGGIGTEDMISENDAAGAIYNAVDNDSFGSTYSAAQSGYMDADAGEGTGAALKRVVVGWYVVCLVVEWSACCLIVGSLVGLWWWGMNLLICGRGCCMVVSWLGAWWSGGRVLGGGVVGGSHRLGRLCMHAITCSGKPSPCFHVAENLGRYCTLFIDANIARLHNTVS